MTNDRLDELAALEALGLLDASERRELLDAANADPGTAGALRAFAETAALLTHDAQEIEPPPRLKAELLRRLPARAAASNLIPFTQWIAYAIAACLMILGISQAMQIAGLEARIRSLQAGEAAQIQNLQAELVTKNDEAGRLQETNELMRLRLETLKAQDATYAASQIEVAWDPSVDRGVVAMQNLPNPPPGHDYQLWVLDPKAQAPISAGLITASRSFTVQPVSTSNPGFAVSLEPTGGRPAPTGPIIFAVAPGQ
jgi:anti-sigma-K factor RskA